MSCSPKVQQVLHKLRTFVGCSSVVVGVEENSDGSMRPSMDHASMDTTVYYWTMHDHSNKNVGTLFIVQQPTTQVCSALLICMYMHALAIMYYMVQYLYVVRMCLLFKCTDVGVGVFHSKPSQNLGWTEGVVARYWEHACIREIAACGRAAQTMFMNSLSIS